MDFQQGSNVRWIIPASVLPEVGQRQNAQQENQLSEEIVINSGEEEMSSGQKQLQE